MPNGTLFWTEPWRLVHNSVQHQAKILSQFKYLQLLLFVEEKQLLQHRVCKSLSGPIFGLCSENLSVVVRGIGFIGSQTRRNATTSRSCYRYHPSHFRPLSSTIDYLSIETFQFHVETTVGDYRKEDLFYNFLLFCTSNQAQRANNVHDVFHKRLLQVVQVR